MAVLLCSFLKFLELFFSSYRTPDYITKFFFARIDLLSPSIVEALSDTLVILQMFPTFLS
jgi:hypothetical protein